MIIWLMWSACSAQEAPNSAPDNDTASRPSVLLITLDTTRADHLPPYGGSVPMPVYTQLASQGAIFTRAYSPYPLTIPSHATIFTGKTPPAHGVRDNGAFVLGAEQVTLAEVFHQAGYTTAAFTAAFPTQAHWGFGQGFSIYHDPLEASPMDRDWRDERIAEDVIEDAIDTLSAQEGPVFAWVHLFDAHWPYSPPEPWSKLYAEDPYMGEIAYTATQLQTLISWWDQQFPQSVVVVTADHGEGLGEGGEHTHGYLLHDGTLRVPLILRGPNVPVGMVYDSPVGLVDIAPTILDLVGLKKPLGIEGKNLLTGGSEWIYAESLLAQRSLGLAPLYSHSDASGRYTIGSFDAFYPFNGNVIETTEVEMQLQGDRKLAIQEVVDQAIVSTGNALDPQTVQRLMALGYLSGISSGVAGETDPRDVIDIIPMIWQVRQSLAHQDFIQAQQQLRALQIRMPKAYGVRLLEGQMHLQMGKLDVALQVFLDLYYQNPNSSAIVLQIGEVFHLVGRWQEAIDWFLYANELYPNNAKIMYKIVECLLYLGEDDLAYEYAMSFLQQHPDHEELQLIYVDFLLLEHRLDDALTIASSVLIKSPHSAKALAVYARVLWAKGESDRAIDMLYESLKKDPRHVGVRITLSEWLTELLRLSEARRVKRPLLDPLRIHK